MYIRPVHAELDHKALFAFVKQYPLGLFTTAIPNPKYDTLQTTHIPFVLDESETLEAGQSSPEGSLGTLRGHMARANPQCKAIIDALRPTSSSKLPEDVLILFNAPVNSYVPPRFYVDTKPNDGKVVPTWNYAAVQVYGTLTAHYENNESTGKYLQKQVEDLSNLQEVEHRDPSGKHGAWKVADAPERYVELLKKGIIGIEIEIKRIEGRFKLSQEDDDGDWNGVVEGFRSLGTDKGEKMAEMVESRGKHRQSKANPPVA
jgi:transcriptional regulator